MEKIIASLWERLVGQSFVPAELAALLRHDGGYDIHEITEETIVRLIQGQYDGDWREPAFSFSELLAYYRILGESLNTRQLVGWVCAIFIVAEAIKRDATDWDTGAFDNFINCFVTVRAQFTTEELIDIFEEVFRGPATI